MDSSPELATVLATLPDRPSPIEIALDWSSA